jgi:hypothetical protein
MSGSDPCYTARSYLHFFNCKLHLHTYIINVCMVNLVNINVVCIGSGPIIHNLECNIGWVGEGCSLNESDFADESELAGIRRER